MLKDVQSEKDTRNIPLKHVGIKDLAWPITLKDKEKGTQNTVASITMAVDLPCEERGTHMSRFVECLTGLGPVSPLVLEKILDLMKEKLKAAKAMLRFKFTYFITKSAPVSGQQAPLAVECIYQAEKEERFRLCTEVDVPIHTLCPCSKEISACGAHNQRAIAKLRVQSDTLVWIEELVSVAESCASAPIYSLLKRPDEKFVTEQAYATPRFVEDAVREIAQALEGDKRIKWYEVEVESMESIHNHNAFACVEKRGK